MTNKSKLVEERIKYFKKHYAWRLPDEHWSSSEKKEEFFEGVFAIELERVERKAYKTGAIKAYERVLDNMAEFESLGCEEVCSIVGSNAQESLHELKTGRRVDEQY